MHRQAAICEWDAGAAAAAGLQSLPPAVAPACTSSALARFVALALIPDVTPLSSQVLGSHNSYHLAPPQELVAAFGGTAGGPLAAWQYTQPPLTEQLDSGVRAFELDAYWDPQVGAGGFDAAAGGRCRHPASSGVSARQQPASIRLPRRADRSPLHNRVARTRRRQA